MKEKTSSDELQKSIQLATNVLDLSEDDRCSGCCNYPKQDYGHPRIVLVNGTSKVMRLQGSNVMNITGKWYFMSKKRTLYQRKRILYRAHCIISLLIPFEEDVCTFLIFSYSVIDQ